MTDSTNTSQHEAAAARGSPVEVFGAFLKLGLTSFGGPIAHLGYFRSEFVERRRWLDDRSYSDLVALCQFLPGPASSQVGMALGLGRAGWPGLLAAWAGFTLPSTPEPRAPAGKTPPYFFSASRGDSTSISSALPTAA